jgi:hypothetical protein
MFTKVQSLLSVRESPPFDILTIQPDIMAQIARVGASHFYSFLTRTEFNRFRDEAPRSIPSFKFEQHPAFPSSYTRDLFCSLNSIMPGNPKFPFRDARNLSHELGDQIRKWAEIQPCEHGGAVLLHEMLARFCYQPFQHSIRTHLPHPMDPAILRQIDEFGRWNPNFPRLLNRDLRPVIQNPQIQCPNGPASNVFISSFRFNCIIAMN